MLQTMWMAAAVTLAFVVKGITGFGNTLVINPLFSLVVSNKVTTPVDLLFSMPANAFVGFRLRRSINWKVVAPLSLMLFIGNIPGVLFLKFGSDRLVRVFLGLVTIGLAFDIRGWPKQRGTARRANRFVLLAIGVLSGVLSGLFGIAAFLLSYVRRTTDNPDAFRADLCCVFFTDNLFRLALYIATGIVTAEVLRTALTLMPFVALGLWIGFLLCRKMKPQAVTRAMVWLLLISGGVLVAQNSIF